MMGALADIDCQLVEWPEAADIFTSEGVARLVSEFDVLVMYDMPGIKFVRGQSPEFVAPSDAVISSWTRLLARGMPILSMHHSIASWPTWPFFAEIVKGRFHYAPADLRGEGFPDSGYAMPVKQVFSVVAPDHPVCAGLPPRFELEDETYQCPIFEDEVTVLITTDAPRDDKFHSSALAAVRREENASWTHPDASPAVAWTHRVDNSTIVYLQPGDGPEAFHNPVYRHLIANAINWLSTTNHSTRKAVQDA